MIKPVWIVDDDQSIRWVLEKALTRENIPHRSFSNPNDVLDALEKEAKKLGIDPDELDIRPDNFMEDPSTGKVKMTDV